jgi:hypothetical protein
MKRLAKYWLIIVFFSPIACFVKYYRDDFHFHPYSPNTSTGWYTGQPCSGIDIDYVVSLKDI